MDRCWECNKEITDEEYIVNWGSCAECFNKQLDKYQAELDKAVAPIQGLND